MDTEEKKLTSEEINDLLKEVASEHQPVRRVNHERKKKPAVRLDMIIAAVVALVVVVGAISLIAHFVDKSKGSAQKETIENPLLEEKYPEISDVVKNYLNAFLIEDAQKRAQIIAQYVGNMYDINNIERRDYISDYSDIECYTKNGPYENTYIVYAYYHMGLKNISTKVPSIAKLYVVRDTKTGKVYIQNDIGPDIKKYMDEVTKDKDVQDLFKDVDKEFQEIKESDANVKVFFDKLKTEADKKEEVASAPKQTTGQQTTTQAAANRK